MGIPKWFIYNTGGIGTMAVISKNDGTYLDHIWWENYIVTPRQPFVSLRKWLLTGSKAPPGVRNSQEICCKSRKIPPGVAVTANSLI